MRPLRKNPVEEEPDTGKTKKGKGKKSKGKSGKGGKGKGGKGGKGGGVKVVGSSGATDDFLLDGAVVPNIAQGMSTEMAFGIGGVVMAGLVAGFFLLTQKAAQIE